MSLPHFFVNIVCLLNINCYFCRSLLSSEESKFFDNFIENGYLLYISPKESAKFFPEIVISDMSHASFVYILCYIFN